MIEIGGRWFRPEAIDMIVPGDPRRRVDTQVWVAGVCHHVGDVPASEIVRKLNEARPARHA